MSLFKFSAEMNFASSADCSFCLFFTGDEQVDFYADYHILWGMFYSSYHYHKCLAKIAY